MQLLDAMAHVLSLLYWTPSVLKSAPPLLEVMALALQLLYPTPSGLELAPQLIFDGWRTRCGVESPDSLSRARVRVPPGGSGRERLCRRSAAMLLRGAAPPSGCDAPRDTEPSQELPSGVPSQT